LIHLPPSHNSNYLAYWYLSYFKLNTRHILAVALLAAFIRPSHILLYAPRVLFTCRLATTQTI
ncbi:hypothetical protein, partial [Providencia huaxiensis]|uniref:hypothetical protein n=1 Tax=Providencia huaxiensis TaxID=2027290 RepID=UPI0032DB34B1